MGIDVRLESVSHRYGGERNAAAVEALRDVSVEIASGAFAVLMGASGSGKSTLLNIIGAVERPARGRVLLDGTDIAGLSERGLTMLRRHSIGYVFQFFNLIPALTVAENVAFPLALAGASARDTRARVNEILEELGIAHRSEHLPSMLSGGEMQRVAIGRAIVHRPGLLLADEPTGNLDSRTGDSILELLSKIRTTYAPTVVLATHSGHAAAIGDFTLHLADGRVVAADPV